MLFPRLKGTNFDEYAYELSRTKSRGACDLLLRTGYPVLDASTAVIDKMGQKEYSATTCRS